MTTGTPASRHAALKALRHGVDQAIGQTQDEVLDVHEREGVERIRTAYGTVVVATRKPAPVIDDERGFLEWVRENRPTEVVETVRESFRKALLDQVEVVGDRVLLRGEILPFASVRPGSGRSYVSVRDAGEAKAAAAEMVLAHVDEITRFAAPEIEP